MNEVQRRIREAIEVTLDRLEQSRDKGYALISITDAELDTISAAAFGQVADIAGFALEPFQIEDQMMAPDDLSRYSKPMLKSQAVRIAALRRALKGEIVPQEIAPRRFYVAANKQHDAARSDDDQLVTFTFCRFETQTYRAADLGEVAFDMLDPQWPEVQAVLRVMQAAIEQQAEPKPAEPAEVIDMAERLAAREAAAERAEFDRHCFWEQSSPSVDGCDQCDGCVDSCKNCPV